MGGNNRSSLEYVDKNLSRLSCDNKVMLYQFRSYVHTMYFQCFPKPTLQTGTDLVRRLISGFCFEVANINFRTNFNRRVNYKSIQEGG